MNKNLKRITQYVFDNGLLIFLILTILPFILLSYFVHPHWDDFDYSVTAAKNGFFRAEYAWYLTWSGRYFSQGFLSSINPLIYGSIAGYKILIIILILAFVFAVYVTFSEIAFGCLNFRQKLICTLSFCYLFIYGLPAANFAFFWMASAVIYQLANILMIFLAYYYIRFLRRESVNWKTNLIISLLIFAISGCNEVSMFITLVFFTVSFIYNSIVAKKIDNGLLLFAAVAVISSSIVYFAPGNSFRETLSPGNHLLFFALKNSFIDLVKFIIYRLYNLPLLMFTVLFISFYMKFILNKKLWKSTVIINPYYSVTVYILAMFAGIFVSYWSLGSSTPFRTLNVIYFIFLAGWFVNIIIILNYINFKKQLPENSIPEYALVLIVLAILISFMNDNNSIKTAYRDLKNGKAEIFNSELKSRYEHIRSSTADTVVVDSLTVIPDSFSYFDIGNDPNNKYNKLQAEFFNKKFIIKK